MRKKVIFLFAIILIMLLVISFAGCENKGENQLPGDSNVTDDKQDIDDGQNPDDEQDPDDEPVLIPTEGLRYILNEDGNGYTVSGIGTATDTDIVIPSEYNGLPVTSIGEVAFYYCYSLTDVYYGGTEEQWNGISIGSYNEELTSANIHFSADSDS